MIPTQPFGRTGHESTRIIFGGYALSGATQTEADRILEMLLKYGVNHIDTAPAYGNAEERIGSWMEQISREVNILQLQAVSQGTQVYLFQIKPA